MKHPIGVFGGTFDPIHFGHLRTGFELLQALRLAEVRFIPAGSPPHREVPLADAGLRLAMVRAARVGLALALFAVFLVTRVVDLARLSVMLTSWAGGSNSRSAG